MKGLYKRYKKWNPVHPTSGFFWGIGIGIGCGVGWGPGFGPEVIGYVGAGCGIGFSVGFTLSGVGIGLPSNNTLESPYNAFVATQRIMMDFGRSSGLFRMADATGVVINNHILPHISDYQRRGSECFSALAIIDSFSKSLDAGNMKNIFSSHSKPVLDGLHTIQRKLFDRQQDTKS